jgi:phosphohistidine phosphatase SixA
MATMLVIAAWPLVGAQAQQPGSADAAWAALAGDGAVALVRHAKAPGPSPDPPGASLADCATQRNLSPEGRAQAAKLGALWREKRVKVGNVVSSPWCRCIETARLMGLGEPTIDHALYNLLADPPDREAKVAALTKMMREWRGPGTLVLVTHGITIRRVAPGAGNPGEAGVVVVKPDLLLARGYVVVGTIPPPE